MKQIPSWFAGKSWVKAGEHFSLRLGSLFFSLVSAHAILWFYNSLADVGSSDSLQRYVPYVIAGGFGLLGYFVSRGLVYRLMHKEPIRVYIAICILFEFVEIVCNFAQAVSSVPAVLWLQRVSGEVHGILLFLLYIAYSIVPVVTFVLAVVDMDLEKARYAPSARTLVGMAGNSVNGYRPQVASGPTHGAVNRGTAAGTPVQAARQGQGQQANGTPAQPAGNAAARNGWKFPFPQRGGQQAGAAQSVNPDVVVS